MSEHTIVSNPSSGRNGFLADQALSNPHSKYRLGDEDESMVAGLRKRCGTAFAELVRRYRHLLLTVALRITKNHEDAEDVVQEAFLKVFQHIESFRGDSLFRTWLTRVAINEALMKLRKDGRRHISIDEHSEDEAGSTIRALPASGCTPEETCSLREIESLAARFFPRVSPASRPVMRLCVEMDLSLAAAAKRLRLDLSAVKSRLWRGRKELRKAVEQYCSSRRNYPLAHSNSDARAGASFNRNETLVSSGRAARLQ